MRNDFTELNKSLFQASGKQKCLKCFIRFARRCPLQGERIFDWFRLHSSTRLYSMVCLSHSAGTHNSTDNHLAKAAWVLSDNKVYIKDNFDVSLPLSFGPHRFKFECADNEANTALIHFSTLLHHFILSSSIYSMYSVPSLPRKKNV